MRSLLLLAVLLLTTSAGCGSTALPPPSVIDVADCSAVQQRYDWLGRDVVLSVHADGCRSPNGEKLDKDAALQTLGSQAWRRASVRVDRVMISIGATDAYGVGPRTLVVANAEATQGWGPAPAAAADAAQRQAGSLADVQVVVLWSIGWMLFLGCGVLVLIALRRGSLLIFVWRRP
jgi:hypothetical protein